MGKMLAFEFRKLFRSKAFYIIALLVIGMIVASNFAQEKLLSALAKEGMGTGEIGSISFESLMMTASSAGMFTTLIAIFTAIFVTEDFALGTIKNIYGRGYGRDLTYYAKYIVCSAATLILLVFAYATAFVYGVVKCTDLTISDKAVKLILLQILYTLIYNTLFFFFSIAIGKTGGTIAVNIVVPTMILSGLSVADYLLKLDIKLYDYWIGNVVDVVRDIGSTTKAVNKSILIMLCYEAALLAFGWYINRKKQIQ